MDRPITGFHQDDEQHWVAELSCGHNQHTRHDPPLSEREWVLTQQGRSSRLGISLACPACDRAEIPEAFAPYKRTPSFTETSVPRALLANHTTKAGVWGRIHVERGELVYSIEGASTGAQRLVPGTQGVVVPEVEHRVEPRGDVSFYVEFWQKIS